jgi:ketosteroid isomerase-like protein
MSSPNVDAVRAFYEASTRDGLEGIMPLLDEQIEWRNPEDSADAAVWHGQQGVRDWFAQTRQSFDEAHFTPGDVKELRDGRVLVLGRLAVTAKQSGIAMEVPFAHLITIRDGLFTRFQQYSDQRRALEAVGLHAAEP